MNVFFTFGRTKQKIIKLGKKPKTPEYVKYVTIQKYNIRFKNGL